MISEGEILHFDKGDDRLEVIGLSFDEAKAALAGIQGGVVTAQAAVFWRGIGAVISAAAGC